jgi:hypothetical protein
MHKAFLSLALAVFAAAGCGASSDGELGVAEDELAGSHHWECSCTCDVSGSAHDETVSWDCPECSSEGNQCKASNGGACVNSHGESGTLGGCGEVLVPNPVPAPQHSAINVSIEDGP